MGDSGAGPTIAPLFEISLDVPNSRKSKGVVMRRRRKKPSHVTAQHAGIRRSPMRGTWIISTTENCSIRKQAATYPNTLSRLPRITPTPVLRGITAETMKRHLHGPNCGHEAVPHGDHIDYLVDGHLHHPHGGHCDDHGRLPKGSD